MKKLITLSAAVFSLLNAFAQDPSFTWGELTEKPGKFENVQFYGGSREGVFGVSSHMPADGESSILFSAFSPIIRVEYFDNRLQKSFTKNATPARADDYVATVFYSDALYVITSSYNKDEGKNILTAKGVNRDGSDAKPMVIGKVSGAKFSQRGRFEAAASPDGSKLVVIGQQEYQKDQNEKFNITVFDKNFVQLSDKEISYDFARSRNAENKPYVNNAGTAFICKKIDLKGSDDRWSVFSFNGTALKEHKIFPDADKRMTSAVPAFSPAGDFVYAGFFGNGNKFRIDIGSPVTGTFIYRIGADGQEMKTSVINPFETRKGMIMRNILFNDKHILLASERYDMTTKNTPAPQGTGAIFITDYSYSSGEMFIDAFDETGKTLYSNSFNKSVDSKNNVGATGGFLPAIAKGKIHLLFNDYKSSYGTRWVVINPPLVIVHSSLNSATGEKADKAMYVETPGPVGDKKGDTDLRPSAYYQLDETHYILRAENATQCRVGMVTFQ